MIVATYGTKRGDSAARRKRPDHVAIPSGRDQHRPGQHAGGCRLAVACLRRGEEGKDFSACLEMRAENGKITCREVYRSTELQANMFNTVAIHEDAAFAWRHRTAGFLHCTDLPTAACSEAGRPRMDQLQQNLVIADGQIFALTANNELVLADATCTGYRERGRVDLETRFRTPQHDARRRAAA